MPSFGGILYVVLLFINSMAVLSEDRFLARSTSFPSLSSLPLLTLHPCLPPTPHPTHPFSLFSFLFHTKVGWSTVPTPNNPTVGFQQPYDQYGGSAGGVQDIGVKGRLINLIGAVRTLMRSMYNSYRILFVHKKKGLTER